MFTLDDILLPLALTVIIDKKVRKPEMDEFCRQAAGLIDLFDLEPMSKSQLMAWYEKKHAELNEDLGGKRKNTIILRALTRFKDTVEMENIYDAMLAISVSDNEYVKEESELIRSAASIWGFSRPPFKVKR
ncbi:hypothetical protein [Hellea balneolensis]|uniref:hypothetical protein n=1 Tax=Hellea balneolensis TaxID=287478 RepID=UPI00047C5901|nr:hypothetical protein [Hellea balneolensis]